jgi:autotransporter-associated beta strand protein
LTASGLVNVTNAGNTFPVLSLAGGNATLNADLNALGNANNGYRIQVDGGSTLNTTTIRLGRGSLNFGSEVAAVGSNTQGLYLNGGDVNLSGALEMGVPSGANSSVSVLMDDGNLKVAGIVTIGINNAGRWSILQVNGGAFTSTEVLTGVSIGGPLAGNAVFAVSGGMATVERIQFGQGTLAGSSVLRLNGGELYVGSGGLVQGSPNVTSIVRLTSGVLAAKADWSGAIPMDTDGLNGNIEVRAADAAGDPHQITLSGVITGTSGIDKTGDGRLLLNAANTYDGTTRVQQGTLGGTGSVKSLLLVESGGTLSPGASVGAFGAGADVTIEGTLKVELDGATCDRLNVTGALDITSGTLEVSVLAGGITAPVYIIASYGSLVPGSGPFASLTGVPAGYTVDYAYNDGTSTKNIALIGTPPASPYETWAAAKGLTGANNGKTQDPDADGKANLTEFAFDGEPLSGVSAGKTRVKIGAVAGSDYLTITFPCRDGAVFSGATDKVSGVVAGGVIYHVEGSDDLATWTTMQVSEVTGASDLTALQAGLPTLSSGWTYRTFRAQNVVAAGNPGDFLRARAEAAP